MSDGSALMDETGPLPAFCFKVNETMVLAIQFLVLAFYCSPLIPRRFCLTATPPVKCVGWLVSVSRTQSSRLRWWVVPEGPPRGARGRGETSMPFGDNDGAEGVSTAVANTLRGEGGHPWVPSVCEMRACELLTPSPFKAF